ncbi:L-aspartate oxidase NadB [Gottschalkia acidurici 9a]|uniref:L-aspartate oxidase n=1 Tax=Gottschalkia acidurici (strain ATCC 7906 / DSM 604 / BCRC 14475 / CIP 104303 / KCTC 5404 / NCIMB 10678 / 9a) TaxID=1128398 RepID=K0AWG9_GOTA9|nr:L-aspartate oxidase [Gottschalkia acidurici]AFS77102.1 L-aspartate oxidase NadB [Gottschalkia acidurici 9a]
MKNWDVIIIGTGISGLFTALNIDEKLKVLVITKTSIDRGNSTLAQGGIVSCINPKIHFEDTLRAGAYYNNQEVIKVVEEDSIENIEKLISYGVNFDKDENGNLRYTREGGHRDRTILYAKDITGKEIIRTLIRQVKNRKNISILEDTFIIKIIKENQSVSGVITLNKNNGIDICKSKLIVVSSGGIGQVYKNTTNLEEITGDGIAIAHESGARIKDMEFVQFHPTAMYEEDNNRRFLISEAVRGEGAILRNINGEAFMNKYHDMADLAPRDIVARSIFKEMESTKTSFVYLDITHKDSKYIKDRFPNIYQNCLDKDIDITKQYIPVAPAEHYIMGGIETDLQGRTNIEGLYACGECACTGLHGANRLASNSLLEGIVFGNRVAKDINNNHDNIKDSKRKLNSQNDIDLTEEYMRHNNVNNKINYKEIEKSLKYTMDKHVSIVRNKGGLLKAFNMVKELEELINKEKVLDKKYFELKNMISVSLLIIEGALGRSESLGAHFII